MSSFVSNLEVQIRKEVEQVLRKHVRRLSGVTHELSNVFLSLDMLTLTTTVLLVERENEIAQSLEEERYNDNSLLKSLSELGLSQEREIKRTLQIMEQKKYFDILEGKDYHPLEVATKLTMHINEIFPQMPGLNLIVYFNQIIDEVLSNRKTVELAVAQIDKTLQIQGASKFKNKSKAKHKSKSKDSKTKTSLASMFKKSKRLSSLNRMKKMKTPPPKPIEQDQLNEPVQPKESIEEKAARLVSDDLGNFVANDFEGAYAINPDEIGAGVTDPQALADMFVGSDDQKKVVLEDDFEISQPDIAVDAGDTNDESQGIDSNAQSYADDLFQSFQSARPADKSATEQQEQINEDEEIEDEDDEEYEEDEDVVDDEDTDDEDAETDDDDADADDDDDDVDTDTDTDDEETEDDENVDADDESGDEEDDEVKRQIDVMNESLRIKRGIRQKSQEALNCPLCHEETIVELETSSHKTYYSCNNDDCKFISWDKPIDQQCPQCDNPFLIEVEIDGEPYYKCPNKNCDYKIKKADVTDETFLTQSQNSEPQVKKKQKKRVRKVRVRRK